MTSARPHLAVIARSPKGDEAISAARACASEERLLRFARNDAEQAACHCKEAEGRRSNPANDNRHDAGFTLVEVAVALAILAFSLSIVLAAMSNGTWRVAQAGAAANASSLAQSLLARAGVEVPLREGRTDGQYPDGFGWTLQMQRLGDAADRPQWPVSAYAVTAEVFWNEASTRRSMAMRTIRLGADEAAR